MADQGPFGIDVVANDKTAAGAKSAEKRLGQIQKHVSAVGKKAFDDGEKSVARSTKGILGHFGAMEKASAKLFGGKPLTSGMTSGITDFKKALGEAAGEGSVLEGTLGTVGIVAGATVGVLAAAGYAASRLATRWATGAASIGRTADTIGVAAKALQEFQAAGERAGVDKGASTSAIGGIAQTLEDAKFGRNNEALALMMRMGLKFKTGADGQIDTAAMTLDLADAISRQKNAQARRLIAGKFGISDAALPMFLAGSGQLKSDMADAGVHAGVIDDAGIARGRRIFRKGVIASQMKDRAMMRAGEATAGLAEGGYDAVIAGGHAIMDGGATFNHSVKSDFVPAARTIGHAADTIDRASGRLEHAISRAAGPGIHAAGRYSSGQIAALARRARPLVAEGMSYGYTEAEAIGIAANMVLESGGETHAKEMGDSRAGRGLYQLTSRDRKRRFKEMFGIDIDYASRRQQWEFLGWELHHTHKRAWQRALAHGQDPEAITEGFTRGVEIPDQRSMDRTVAERRAVAEALEALPVHITIDAKGLPHGSKITAAAGRSSRPAVSHAFVFEPVHGG